MRFASGKLHHFFALFTTFVSLYTTFPEISTLFLKFFCRSRARSRQISPILALQSRRFCHFWPDFLNPFVNYEQIVVCCASLSECRRRGRCRKGYNPPDILYHKILYRSTFSGQKCTILQNFSYAGQKIVLIAKRTAIFFHFGYKFFLLYFLNITKLYVNRCLKIFCKQIWNSGFNSQTPEHNKSRPG